MTKICLYDIKSASGRGGRMSPRLRSLLEGLVGRNLVVIGMGIQAFSGRINEIEILPNSCVTVQIETVSGEVHPVDLGLITTTIHNLTSGEVNFGCGIGSGRVTQTRI